MPQDNRLAISRFYCFRTSFLNDCKEFILSNYDKNVCVETRAYDGIAELAEAEKTALFNALDNLSKPNAEFRKLDIKNLSFKLTAQYPRNQFKNDILKLVQNLDATEKSKVWDYFGFEIKPNKYGDMVMSGYPALLINGEKLAEIENPETKSVIEQIKPYIKKFTDENSNDSEEIL